tara:strand:- start:533 stop:697 length:165 start_codon:yes stop_codon:yes gene_type:complete
VFLLELLLMILVMEKGHIQKIYNLQHHLHLQLMFLRHHLQLLNNLHHKKRKAMF